MQLGLNRASAYEVKLSDHAGDERLYIGTASDLRIRVRQGLVKGKMPHPGGTRIRAEQDLERLVVRWSLTDRPAAAGGTAPRLRPQVRAAAGIRPQHLTLRPAAHGLAVAGPAGLLIGVIQHRAGAVQGAGHDVAVDPVSGVDAAVPEPA
jgi:hypothetical protein